MNTIYRLFDSTGRDCGLWSWEFILALWDERDILYVNETAQEVHLTIEGCF